MNTIGVFLYNVLEFLNFEKGLGRIIGLHCYIWYAIIEKWKIWVLIHLIRA